MPKPLRRPPINLYALDYDAAKTVTSANQGEATRRDWDRFAKAGDECRYYINGVKLSDIRKEGFATLDDLKAFFIQHLFNDLQPPATPQLAADQACLRFHQAGIQNATFNDFERHDMQHFKFSAPAVTTVHFNSTPSGVQIIEAHIIDQWFENTTIKHKSDDYCVTTETTYFFKPGDPGQISLEDMRIDCRDPALKPVFAKYDQETPAEEYQHTLSELKDSIEPKLYYPQSLEHQSNIRRDCRNCFYIDYVTQDLHYINAYGTVIPVPETSLLSKEIGDITKVGEARVIEFELPNQHSPSEIYVPHHYSSKFGHVMHMTHAKMKMMIPESFQTDLLVKYSENLLMKLQYEQALLSKMSSLFGVDSEVAIQERRAILAIVQQFATRQSALQMRKYRQKPPAMTFAEEGESLYVFVENEEHPDKSRFWYVDRSAAIPKWIEFPINLDQAVQIHTLFAGAEHLQKDEPKPTDPDYERDLAWYHLGKAAKTTQQADHSVSLTLEADACKKVINLLVSPMQLGQTLVEDLSYNEAFDALTNTLQTTTVSEQNQQIIQRCGQIQRMLRSFGENFDHYFPKTRGIMSYDKRIQVLNMLNDIVTDPASSKAQHYFRNRHRIYHEAYSTTNPFNYDPSSFVWLDQSLYYIDENLDSVPVPMTSAIEETLRRLSTTNPAYISAEDVYDLMTRPRVFNYYRVWPIGLSLPIGLNCRAFEFKYCIPVGFDRSRGLHTGTAQEMMLEVRDIHLSLRLLLFKLFNFFLMVVLPAILQGFGYAIPLTWLGLNALAQSITNWVVLVWNVSLLYSLLAWIGVSNLLVRPEFNALDKALQELSLELDQHRPPDEISSVPLSDLSSDTDSSEKTVPYCYTGRTY